MEDWSEALEKKTMYVKAISPSPAPVTSRPLLEKTVKQIGKSK